METMKVSQTKAGEAPEAKTKTGGGFRGEKGKNEAKQRFHGLGNRRTAKPANSAAKRFGLRGRVRFSFWGTSEALPALAKQFRRGAARSRRYLLSGAAVIACCAKRPLRAVNKKESEPLRLP